MPIVNSLKDIDKIKVLTDILIPKYRLNPEFCKSSIFINTIL